MTEVDGPSPAGLVGSIVGNIQAIIRDEIQLAGVELREGGRRLQRAAAFLVAAVWLATLGLGWLMYAAITALATTLALWAAALLVSGVVLVAGGVLAYMGVSQIRSMRAPLARTKNSVREVIQWNNTPGQ